MLFPMFCCCFFLNLYILSILSKVACPDMHFKLNKQFLLENISLTPNFHGSSKTRTQQTHKKCSDSPSQQIFFTVSYTYDCPVSRYTVQDKPLFVITTIQNRISQTVCTTIEHTIEHDI